MKIRQPRIRSHGPGQQVTHMQVSDSYREGTIEMVAEEPDLSNRKQLQSAQDAKE